MLLIMHMIIHMMPDHAADRQNQIKNLELLVDIFSGYIIDLVFLCDENDLTIIMGF